MSQKPSRSGYQVRKASWQADNAALRTVRKLVFILEQHVPEELEWDDEDVTALHLLAEDDNGHPIGTARLLTDGHIGRVAVLSPWRHSGVGLSLMYEVLKKARDAGHPEVFLDAQVDAIAFYQRLGFVAEGKIFMDAGIPHRHMRLKLEDKAFSE